jgi:hypothetical protein
MSILAEFPRGIPISADKVEEIRAALQSAAYPGFTGTLQLEICPTPEAAQHVMIAVIRRQTQRADQASATSSRQLLPDLERKKPVQNVIDAIKSKLVIRTVMLAVEGYFVDGVLQKFQVAE